MRIPWAAAKQISMRERLRFLFHGIKMDVKIGVCSNISPCCVFFYSVFYGPTETLFCGRNWFDETYRKMIDIFDPTVKGGYIACPIHLQTKRFRILIKCSKCKELSGKCRLE